MARRSILYRWGRWYVGVALVWLVVLLALASSVISGGEPAAAHRALAGFGALVVASIGLLGWALWWPWMHRLRRMEETVRSYAQGDYSPRLSVDDTELGRVSSELNWMAQQMHSRMLVEAARQQEQKAVLSSMAEGVLAIDNDGCIISINEAARNLLSVSDPTVEGRQVGEIVRQDDLLQFIRNASGTDTPSKADLLLRGAEPRQVLVNSTVLQGGAGNRQGILVVVSDVTDLRRLESVRRDFVANVSHELKTPITSIKGFMETLRDGAIHNPEEADRFLTIIAKQADRLESIIEDLLSLSRIEQESEAGAMHKERTPLRPVLEGAVSITRMRLEDGEAHIAIDCPPDLTASLNAPLFEQAIINLLDNAVKYGGKAARIDLRVEKTSHQVKVEVSDTGPGIEPEHQPYVFARFYRVDKSRSRNLGGTGLGLSIVKHITHAHGGTVSLSSQPGEGSTFTIVLPD